MWMNKTMLKFRLICPNLTGSQTHVLSKQLILQNRDMSPFDTRNKALLLNFVLSGPILYMKIQLTRQKMATLRVIIG